MYRNVVVYFHLTLNVKEAVLNVFRSLGVPLEQFQEAVNEMCSAKKVFWKFQARFFKSTCD